MEGAIKELRRFETSLFVEMLRNVQENKCNTGKSFSEALILTSTNPQCDKRLFIESPVQYKKIPSSEHVVYINCSEYQKK